MGATTLLGVGNEAVSKKIVFNSLGELINIAGSSWFYGHLQYSRKVLQ